MVEYVGVIRKEVVSAMTPTGPQLQYTMGSNKDDPNRKFTAETFAPTARNVAIRGEKKQGARGFGTVGAGNFQGPMLPSQSNTAQRAASRGSRFANRAQRFGQGLGSALGGIAGMVSLANAGAQGQDLMSGALSAGQTGKFVSDAVSPTLGNVAGDVAGRVGVATTRQTPRENIPVDNQGRVDATNGQKQIGVGQAANPTLLPERAASLQEPVKPFTKPVATQDKVRVKQHQNEFSIPENFELGKIPTQRSDGKSGSQWDMYGKDKNVKRTKGYQDSLATANQQPVAVEQTAPAQPAPAQPAQPAATNLPTQEQVPVLPATAPMNTANVQPAAPAAPAAPASSLTPQQTSAVGVVAGQQQQPTEPETPEGSDSTGLTPEQAAAAKEAGKMTMVSPEAADANKITQSTNPKRFVGVI